MRRLALLALLMVLVLTAAACPGRPSRWQRTPPTPTTEARVEYLWDTDAAQDECEWRLTEEAGATAPYVFGEFTPDRDLFLLPATDSAGVRYTCWVGADESTGQAWVERWSLTG